MYNLLILELEKVLLEGFSYIKFYAHCSHLRLSIKGGGNQKNYTVNKKRWKFEKKIIFAVTKLIT